MQNNTTKAKDGGGLPPLDVSLVSSAQQRREAFLNKLRGYKTITELYACASPIHSEKRTETNEDLLAGVYLQSPKQSGLDKVPKTEAEQEIQLMHPTRKTEYPAIMTKQLIVRGDPESSVSPRLPSLKLFFQPKPFRENSSDEIDLAIDLASEIWESDLEFFKGRGNRLAHALYQQMPTAMRGHAPPARSIAETSDESSDDEPTQDEIKTTNQTDFMSGFRTPELQQTTSLNEADILSGNSVALKPLDAQSAIRALERDRKPLSARSAFIEKSIELGIIPLAKLHREGVIELAQYRMGDSTAVAFAEVLRASRVEHLDLTDTGIGPRGAAAIFLAIATKTELRVLNMSGNNIAKQGCEVLASSLGLLAEHRAEGSAMEQLNVSRNSLTDFAAMPLLKCLPSVLPGLIHLDLSNNKLGGMKTCIKHLVSALSQLSNLKHCDLSWNFINGAVGEQIATILRTNSNLEVMKLEFNNIGEIGGLSMGSMLRENHTLKSLDISHNNISQRACMLIADGLRANSTLKVLELNGNPVGRDGGRALLRAVSQSTAGCRLGVHDCNFQHTDPHMFNPAQASGVYHLNLSEPYERAIAEELLQLARSSAKVETDAATSSDEEESDDGESYFTDLSQVQDPTQAPKRRLWSGEEEAQVLNTDAEDEPVLEEKEELPDTSDEIAIVEHNADSEGSKQITPKRNSMTSSSKRTNGALLLMQNSSSQFSINLSVEEYRASHWPWKHVKIDGVAVVADARQVEFVLPESGLLELEFRELSRKKTNDDALRESGFKAVYDLVTTIMTKDSFGSKALQMIQQACEDNYFTASQAKVLAQILPSAEMRVKAVRSLYGRIVDIPNRDKIFELLDTKSIITVQQSIGPLCQLNVDNAMGYYRLDLASPEEREVALRLIELNSEEVRKRQKRKGGTLCDISQYQNWCAFRNLRFWPTVEQTKDELPTPITDFVPTMAKSRLAYIDFLWSNSWTLPRRGTLELDFVSWKLPPRMAQPMMTAEIKLRLEGYKSKLGGLEGVEEGEVGGNVGELDTTQQQQQQRLTFRRRSTQIKNAAGSTDYERIMHQLLMQQELDVFDNCFESFMTALEQHRYTEEKLLYLRALSSGFYFTTEQVFRIARAVSESKFVLFDRKKKVPTIIRQAYLSEVLVMLYARIVDKEAFRKLFYDLPVETGTVVSSRIGQLHLFDPMSPDRPYRLDLSLPDENMVASMLIELAIKEPGENWQNEMYQGRKFELPVTWVKEPPQRGILTLSYESPQKQEQLAKCIPVREALCTKVSVKERRPKSVVSIPATKSLVRTANALVMANMTGWYIRQLKLVVVRFLREMPTEVQDHVMKLMKRLANARNAKLQRIVAQRKQLAREAMERAAREKELAQKALEENCDSADGSQDEEHNSVSSESETSEESEASSLSSSESDSAPTLTSFRASGPSLDAKKLLGDDATSSTKETLSNKRITQSKSDTGSVGKQRKKNKKSKKRSSDRKDSTDSAASVEGKGCDGANTAGYDENIQRRTDDTTASTLCKNGNETGTTIGAGKGWDHEAPGIEQLLAGSSAELGADEDLMIGDGDIEEMFGTMGHFGQSSASLLSEDSDISEEEFFDPFLPLDLPTLPAADDKPESVLSTKQRLFVVMMFQVIDQDLSDAISLEEILSFNKTSDEVTEAEKQNIEVVTEYFQKNVTQLGFTEEEDQVTPDEWLELWEELVRDKGDQILDDFVKGFDHRAREIEGDDTFEFMTYALREAEKMNEKLEADVFLMPDLDLPSGKRA